MLPEPSQSKTLKFKITQFTPKSKRNASYLFNLNFIVERLFQANMMFIFIALINAVYSRRDWISGN